MNPELKKLLNLQEHDSKRIELEWQLRHLPQEEQVLKNKLATERATFEESQLAFKQLEVNRRDLDSQLKLTEEKLVQCRTKQSMVKKEDEYNALTTEIATLVAKSDDIETAELELLMQIDDETKGFNDREVHFKAREAELNKQMEQLKVKEAALQVELNELRALCSEAEKHVEARLLTAYQDAKRRAKKPPFVVPLDEQRCGGCFLKVSNDIAKEAQDTGSPHNCDNCGRLVYVG